MNKTIKKSKLFLILLIFIISGCSTKNEIEFDDDKLIYKDATYSVDDNYLPIICEGDKVEIEKKYSIFGTFNYYLSFFDENNNIIYDGKKQWFKDGFVPPNYSKDNIYKMYLSTSFAGDFNADIKRSNVIQFDSLDGVCFGDIFIKTEIDGLDIMNNNENVFWLSVVYSNYKYMSMTYFIYFINDEVYLTKFSDYTHLYKVSDNYKSYFIEAIFYIL